MRGRVGYTLVEVLLTLTIIGTLSAVAMPKYEDMKRRAKASQVLSDVETVRNATYSFFSDSGYFPAQPGPGTVPTNLDKYLPRAFTFQKPDWQIDYESWTITASPTYVKNNVSVGVSVTPTDTKVGAAALSMYGSLPKFVVGAKYTFMIVGG